MDEQTLVDADGVNVFVRRWIRRREPRAAVVIVHGASEHAGRYARVAGILAEEGFAVYALDLRGHGRTGESTGPGRLGPRGMEGVLDDVGLVVASAAREVGDRPIVLVGHSMGSVITQAFVEQREHGLSAYVLSGSMGAMEGIDEIADGIRQAVDAGMSDEPLDMLSGFNDAFEPARTNYDWLSRDPDEVDKYVADPLCGDSNPLTYGFVAGLFEALALVMEPAEIARIPRHLPVLLITGEEDPVSGGAVQVRELESRLRDAGLDVTAVYYPGARHEVLNETNRDEVHRDLITWLHHLTEVESRGT